MPATVVLPALDRFSDEYAPAEMLAGLDPKADPDGSDGPGNRIGFVDHRLSDTGFRVAKSRQ